MKCPKCGYVSFSGQGECRKCGHPLSQPADAGRAGRASASLRLDFDGELRPNSTASPKSDPASPSTGARGGEDILDRAFAGGPARGKKPDLEFNSMDARLKARPPAPRRNLPERAPENFAAAARSEPMVIEFAVAPSSYAQPDLDEVPIAPLGRRFLAGVLDALVLLAAGGVFAGLFAAAHGKMDAQPLDLAVAAFIALFGIFFYFGLFGTLALSSPGQAAMGLTVRNLDGGLPTRQETLLRAFGYVISIVALMIGFLWAAMDGDGMAWHDHISGTLLAVAGPPANTPS